MNKDIRISITFSDHPKTVKLMRRVGAEGVLCLLRLWGYAAQYRPAGSLVGMSDEDIEIAAGWKGDLGAWVQAAVEVRYFDRDENGEILLHDWAEHNPYAFHAKERAEKAKKGAEARWGKPSDAKEDAETDAKKCSKHDLALPQASSSNTPSPAPSPSPNISTPVGVEGRSKAAPPPCPHEDIIAAYHEILPTCPQVRDWHDTRQGLLRARWREDPKRQNLGWWRKYFAYVAQSDFLTGRAEPRKGSPPFVADLEWLIRPSNFAKVREGKYDNAS